MRKIILISLLAGLGFTLFGQEKYIDRDVKEKLDSLDGRIKYLNEQLPILSATRDTKFFFLKRELEHTIFLRKYEEMVFDEDIIAAQKLIDINIKASEKRADEYSKDFYNEYKKKLTIIRSLKRARYQKLLAKEKSFQKEFKDYVGKGDIYSLQRTKRMVELAIKYAEETKWKQAMVYLIKYHKYIVAMIYDDGSDYDLQKLTNNVSSFNKAFQPLLESDSLSIIQDAGTLVEQCYSYAGATYTELDSNFFAKQRILVANSLADWNERQGLNTELSTLTGQSIVARTDSLNREGIYSWNDYILIIGTVQFSSKSENVKIGEAIIDADNTMLHYLKVNKLAKISSDKEVKFSQTVLLKYIEADRKTYFKYDINKQEWQYMACYTGVINKKVTYEVKRFLLPLQFVE